MMRKEIWTEPVLGMNRQQFIERCQEAVLAGREKTFIYLVSTRPLLDHIVARIIDGERVQGCYRLPVFLFDGLVRYILTLAHADLTVIDDGAKYFLIEQVMGRLVEEKALKHLTDIALLPGCVDAIGEIIGQLKRASQRPDEFREFIEAVAHIDERDQDVAKIYEAYQDVLGRRRLMDQDDAYVVVRDKLAGEPGLPTWLEHVQTLFIDGFFDLTPIQKNLVHYLAIRMPEVVVNLSMDHRHPTVSEPINETRQFFEQLGFDCAQRPPGAVPHHADLDALCVNLFHADPSPSRRQPPIKILSAPDMMQEARELAKEIKHLVLDEGFRPADIAVIVREPSGYTETIRRVFADEGIPCALDLREMVTTIPSVKAALKVLESRCGWLRADSFVALLKNDYLESFCPIDRDAVDNAMLVVGVQLTTKEWLERAKGLLRLKQRELERAQARTIDPEEIELEAARLQRGAAQLEGAIQAVTAMRDTLLKIPERATISELVATFQDALRAFGLRLRLQAQLRSAGIAEQDLGNIARDLRGLEKMQQVLAQVEHISRDPNIHLERTDVITFKNLLSHLLARASLLTQRGDPGGVFVLEVTRARALPFRAVFVAGLTEGRFPQSAPRDWVYPSKEREILANAGLFLESLSPTEFRQKEAHFFYQAVCQATERLYLSYPRVVGDNEETIPSSFIEDVRQVYRVDNESTINVEYLTASTMKLDRVSTPIELARAVLTRLWQMPREDEPLLLELYNASLDERILRPSVFARLDIEAQRDGPMFGPFDGLLGDPAILRQLRQRFSRERIYSASQFNTYGACPFQFFAQRILRLDPREEASLDLLAVDKGKLLHDILYEFLHGHTDESLIPERLDEYREEMRKLSTDLLTAYEHLALPLNPALWELEKADLTDVTLNFLEAEVKYQEQVAPHRVQPHWLELGFGMTDPEKTHSALRPQHLTLQRGDDAIRIRGRIDRVDRSSDGQFVAYDYKSSRGFSRADMEEGRDLQIPLYIRAIREIFLNEGESVIGGGYYAISDGKRLNGLYRADRQGYTGLTGRAGANVDPPHFETVLRLAERYAWRYVDGMRRGDFRVAPKEQSCCPRCVYSTVCRFDKNRIRRKLTVEEQKPTDDA